MENIKEAVRSSENGKAHGRDDIYPEMVKYTSAVATKLLVEIFNEAWRRQRMTKEAERISVIKQKNGTVGLMIVITIEGFHWSV